ncbi:MAG: patatin family protein [Spirochaetes bacterium]|nr:patatin family protein [Spirochaetota bacterium]
MFDFLRINRGERRKALIIEGGGMRGIFIVGVLQAFEDRKYFPWKIIAGSSAGALTGTAYAANQIYIARDIFFTKLISDTFINFKHILKKDKHIMNLDWLIKDVLEGDDPIDQKKLRKSVPVIITGTNIPDNGDPETLYFNSKKDDLKKILTATAALPYLYRGFVNYQNHNLLDGALLDPLPYDYVKSLGYKDKDITIILTRQKNYRKKSESFWISSIYENYYKDPKYKGLLNLLDKRFVRYNNFLDDLETNHPDLRMIYPPEDFKVNRLSQDMESLMKGFQDGIKSGKKYLREIHKMK